MLNRRILRIKAFKTLYSYALDPTLTLAEAESQLERSCEATRSLYLFMLSVIPALTGEARTRIEEASRKFHPTEEERNPNLKFVRNALAPILSDDPDFQKALSRVKLSWDQYDAFLRALYESVRSGRPSLHPHFRGGIRRQRRPGRHPGGTVDLVERRPGIRADLLLRHAQGPVPRGTVVAAAALPQRDDRRSRQ